MINVNINQCQINKTGGLDPCNIAICGSICVLVQARGAFLEGVGDGGVRACPSAAHGQCNPSPSIQAVQCRVRMTLDASTRPNVLRCCVVLDITIGRLGRQLNSIINNIKLYKS
jgi:hypothetical protein